MFIKSADYEAHVKKIIEGSSAVRVAVAFWDRGAQALIECRPKDASVQVICNLLSGATHPAPIRAFRDAGNFSANGMTLSPEELDGWHEAALLSADAKDVEAAKTWFNDLFGKAVEVEEDHLEEAHEP